MEKFIIKVSRALKIKFRNMNTNLCQMVSMSSKIQKDQSKV